jgi:hypothetical protein
MQEQLAGVVRSASQGHELALRMNSGVQAMKDPKARVMVSQSTHESNLDDELCFFSFHTKIMIE